jgi:hypothetical protein
MQLLVYVAPFVTCVGHVASNDGVIIVNCNEAFLDHFKLFSRMKLKIAARKRDRYEYILNSKR